MECISRKKDHWDPPSMIIPDDHKMARNVSDSPSPWYRDLHNYKGVPYEAVIKTTRTFEHRVHIIRTVHTRDRKGACADTFVFKNLAPSGVRVCQNQKRFLFSTRIRIKVWFMVNLLNSNGIKDDYSLFPLMFMRKYSSGKAEFYFAPLALYLCSVMVIRQSDCWNSVRGS